MVRNNENIQGLDILGINYLLTVKERDKSCFIDNNIGIFTGLSVYTEALRSLSSITFVDDILCGHTNHIFYMPSFSWIDNKTQSYDSTSPPHSSSLVGGTPLFDRFERFTGCDVIIGVVCCC